MGEDRITELEFRICELERELEAEQGESARQRLVTQMTVVNSKVTQLERNEARYCARRLLDLLDPFYPNAALEQILKEFPWLNEEWNG